MTTRPGRLVLAALTPLLGAACADQVPGGPAPAAQEVLADSLVMAPGDAVVVGHLWLAFLEVAEDSRCPIDVVCVWQGNAAVQIAVGLGRGPGVPRTLNTSEPDVPVEFGGYRVTLLQVRPAPQAGVPILSEDYRAVFQIEALED
jgi:hypothetical protein